MDKAQVINLESTAFRSFSRVLFVESQVLGMFHAETADRLSDDSVDGKGCITDQFGC